MGREIVCVHSTSSKFRKFKLANFCGACSWTHTWQIRMRDRTVLAYRALARGFPIVHVADSSSSRGRNIMSKSENKKGGKQSPRANPHGFAPVRHFGIAQNEAPRKTVLVNTHLRRIFRVVPTFWIQVSWGCRTLRVSTCSSHSGKACGRHERSGEGVER